MSREFHITYDSLKKFLFLSFLAVLIIYCMQGLFYSQNVETAPSSKEGSVNSHPPVDYTTVVRSRIASSYGELNPDPSLIPPFQRAKSFFTVIPREKLSQCHIEGTMATEFINIFCYLFDPVVFLNGEQTITQHNFDHRLCKSKIGTPGYENMIRHQPFGYKSIFITRDPLARFASLYETKCEEDDECFDCATDDLMCILKGIKSSLEEEMEDLDDNNARASIDMDFVPQTWHCSLHKTHELTTFLRFEEGSQYKRLISKYATTLLQHGIPTRDIDYVRDEMRKIDESSWIGNFDVADRIQNDKALLALFLEIYQHDYFYFDYPIPVI